MQGNTNKTEPSLELIPAPKKILNIYSVIKKSPYNQLIKDINVIDKQEQTKIVLLEDNDNTRENNFIFNLSLYIINKLQRDYVIVTNEHLLTKESQNSLYTSLNKKKLAQPIILIENLNDLSGANIPDVLGKLSSSYLVLTAAPQIKKIPNTIKQLFIAPCAHADTLIKRIVPYDQKTAIQFKTTRLCNQLFPTNAPACIALILDWSENPNLESLKILSTWIQSHAIDCLKTSDDFADTQEQITLKLWSLIHLKNSSLLHKMLSQVAISQSENLSIQESYNTVTTKNYKNVIDLEENTRLIQHYNEIEKIFFDE